MSRILFISHIFPPSIDGGSRVIYKLGQYFEFQNHQALYLSSDCTSTDDFIKKNKTFKSPKPHSSNALRVPVYHSLRRPLKFINLFIPKNSYLHGLIKVFQKGPIFKILPFLKALIKIIKFKPEYIIAGPLPTTIVLYANFFKFLTKVLTRQSAKVLINSSFHPNDPDFQQKPLIKTLKKADFLWTLTQFETDYFIKNFNINPSKIILAGNGIDKSFIKHHSTNVLRRQTTNVLYIGSLSAHKRVDLLIKSFSNVLTLQSSKALSLTIAGQKTLYFPYIQKLVNQLPPHIKIKIKFIFNFSNNKLADIIDNCDFLILPSIHESFGLVLIESWARSKPVIVSNIKSLSEIVSNSSGGLIFNTDDQTDLENKILKLINSPQLRYQLGQNGLNYVKNNYTWEKVGQKINQKLFLSV